MFNYDEDYDTRERWCDGCSARKNIYAFLAAEKISVQDIFCGHCVKELIKIRVEHTLNDQEVYHE